MGSHYPKISLDFVIDLLTKSDKVEYAGHIRGTLSFVLKGSKPIGKRLILIRAFDNEVDYEAAIAIGYKTGELEAITKWLEINKSWKDGAYVST